MTGRWPSKDPIGENGGLNLYDFVGNDGANRWDAFGLAISSYQGDPATFVLTPQTEEEINPHKGQHRAGVTRLDSWKVKAKQKSKTVNGHKCYGVEISGELKLSGYFNSTLGSDPDRGAHKPGGLFSRVLSTLEHERRHVAIYAEWWDLTVQLVNVYEHDYCTKECAQAAAEIVEYTSGLHRGHAEIEHGEFDRMEYGGGQKSTRQGLALVSLYESQLEHSLKTFNENNCFAKLCESK